MRTRPPRLSRLVFVLYLLLVAALATTGMSSAAYRSTATGSDSARVAKFDVSMTAQQQELTISGSAGTAFYGFTISSSSEVPVAYSVTIAFTAAPPAGVSLTLGSDTHHCNGSATAFTFPNVGSIPLGGGANTHTLKISADLTQITTAFEDSHITISAHVEQI